MRLAPEYPVTTDRLQLRPLTPADVPALLRYRGDPEVCRYLPFDPMTEPVLRARLAGDLGRTAIDAEGGALTLGVFRQGDGDPGGDPDRRSSGDPGGDLVGDVVLFFRSAEHRGGELGYVFDPAAGGRGFATEACRAVLDLAFDPAHLGLHRVTALMDARNTASARLAARLGMRREAHFVRNEMFKGEWSDLVVFAVLAEEWRAGRAV